LDNYVLIIVDISLMKHLFCFWKLVMSPKTCTLVILPSVAYELHV